MTEILSKDALVAAVHAEWQLIKEKGAFTSELGTIQNQQFFFDLFEQCLDLGIDKLLSWKDLPKELAHLEQFAKNEEKRAEQFKNFRGIGNSQEDFSHFRIKNLAQRVIFSVTQLIFQFTDYYQIQSDLMIYWQFCLYDDFNLEIVLPIRQIFLDHEAQILANLSWKPDVPGYSSLKILVFPYYIIKLTTPPTLSYTFYDGNEEPAMVTNYATAVTPSFYLGFAKSPFGTYLVLGLQLAILILVILPSPLSLPWIGLAAGLALGGGIGLSAVTKTTLLPEELEQKRTTRQGIPRSQLTGILTWSWLLFLVIHQLLWVCM
jgi:hypothetical protein